MTDRKKNHPGLFQKGDQRTVEAARRGGKRKALKAAGHFPPFEGTILDVMDAAGLKGDTWTAWRTFWKAVYALPMDEAELEVFRRHTDRETPPKEAVKEAFMAMGRRSGKSHNSALAGWFQGTRFDSEQLAPGELAVIPIIAADRRQARQVLGYLKGLAQLPEFQKYVSRILKERIELHNRVNLEVVTANYRTVRGFTCPAVVCDEIAFWLTDEGSANPDSEILTALRPAMATAPDALLLGLSSPYAARGELYKAVERSFGQDDPHTLIWNADTLSMNPGVPRRIIDRAFEEDPVSAASEYGQDGRVQFRRDVEAFLDPVAVREVTVDGRLELAPEPGKRYTAFVDPSGGSQDSFTLAIGHSGNGLAVLDAVREVRPPFSPDDVVRDFAALLRTYGVREVTGDRYGGEWPASRFGAHGVRYVPSKLTKSDIYREFVAPVNAGQVALLDIPVLRAQLVGLERRVSRGGRDSIDHAPGGRDDVANSAAGVLTLVGTPKRQPASVFEWSI